jgi:hypothetical protein
LGGKPTYLICAGRRFKTSFEKLMRNEFSSDPMVLWWGNKQGRFFGAPTKENGLEGIKSTFNYYETTVGRFIVSPCRYFDSRYHASNFNAQGDRYESYRAFVFNISETIQGDGFNEALHLVSLPGRRMVKGKIGGMSSVPADGQIATSVDGETEHYLTQIGIAVGNPNMFGEFTAPQSSFSS